MTAIIVKTLSAVMSVVVFLSGMFPALFGGKVYIDPNGNEVTVVSDINIGEENLIINDYDEFEKLGDIGINYSEDFFEEKSLAVATIKMQEDDKLYILSIFAEGTNVEMEYLIDYGQGLAAQLGKIYMPDDKTVFIEIDKNIQLFKTTDFGKKNMFFPS